MNNRIEDGQIQSLRTALREATDDRDQVLERYRAWIMQQPQLMASLSAL